MLKFNSFRGSLGFSLLEVCLVIGLGALMMASLTTIFQVGKRSWNENNNKSEAIQHARVAVSRLAAELRYATNLAQANSSGIAFDTTVLMDSNELTTERIHYDIIGNTLQRCVDPCTSLNRYIIAGDSAGGGIVARLLAVQPMKMDTANNLVPLIVMIDPLSIAVALSVDMTMTSSSNTVEVKTLVNFRDK